MAQFVDPDVRHAIRNQVRTEMRNHSFIFADDPSELGGFNAGESASDLAAQRSAALDAAEYRPLIAEALEASSTDHPTQGIQMTLSSGVLFWSSTGRASPHGQEWLLYRLASPLCRLRFVKLGVYRALYQHGAPLYPPAAVSFEVGPSPHALRPAGPKYAVAPTDRDQVFALPPEAPLGGYLRVVCHGMRQKQWDDDMYYLAIRHVSAVGLELPVTALAGLQQALHEARLAYSLHTAPLALPAAAGTDAAAAGEEGVRRDVRVAGDAGRGPGSSSSSSGGSRSGSAGGCCGGGGHSAPCACCFARAFRAVQPRPAPAAAPKPHAAAVVQQAVGSAGACSSRDGGSSGGDASSSSMIRAAIGGPQQPAPLAPPPPPPLPQQAARTPQTAAPGLAGGAHLPDHPLLRLIDQNRQFTTLGSTGGGPGSAFPPFSGSRGAGEHREKPTLLAAEVQRWTSPAHAAATPKGARRLPLFQQAAVAGQACSAAAGDGAVLATVQQQWPVALYDGGWASCEEF